MKYASPASRRVRRLVSSLRMIAAPVRCSVNAVDVDSGAPVALKPTSRTRQTRGPSTPISPWAIVWTCGDPAVNSAGAAAAGAAGGGCTAAGEAGWAGRSWAAARSPKGNSVAAVIAMLSSAANLIAYALVASRHVDAAIVWLDMHAASDTDEDAHGGADFDAEHYLYT